jgi:hypothetical protein
MAARQGHNSQPFIKLFDYKLTTDMHSFFASFVPESLTKTPSKVVILTVLV